MIQELEEMHKNFGLNELEVNERNEMLQECKNAIANMVADAENGKHNGKVVTVEELEKIIDNG